MDREQLAFCIFIVLVTLLVAVLMFVSEQEPISFGVAASSAALLWVLIPKYRAMPKDQLTGSPGDIPVISARVPAEKMRPAARNSKRGVGDIHDFDVRCGLMGESMIENLERTGSLGDNRILQRALYTGSQAERAAVRRMQSGKECYRKYYEETLNHTMNRDWWGEDEV